MKTIMSGLATAFIIAPIIVMAMSGVPPVAYAQENDLPESLQEVVDVGCHMFYEWHLDHQDQLDDIERYIRRQEANDGVFTRQFKKDLRAYEKFVSALTEAYQVMQDKGGCSHE